MESPRIIALIMLLFGGVILGVGLGLLFIQSISFSWFLCATGLFIILLSLYLLIGEKSSKNFTGSPNSQSSPVVSQGGTEESWSPQPLR